ncbi:hypothetical protein NQ314_019685 [Rhamnusium bicolor]|uniref:Uncharacterized protein n=1 Tax=Rhamnusium bicolor TaxID=1586634 RepID=A0AAV8WM50_9CUCU|nr:hypothetical protein NQ314_019685 [Rhamnusium bicolor]
MNEVHTNSIIILWKEIYHIDEEIKMTGIKLNYKRLKWSSLITCILGIVSHTTYLLVLACSQEYKK